MSRVALTINEIRQRASGNGCLIHPNGKIYFAQPVTSSDRLQLSVTQYETDLQVEDLPDKYTLAFQYYVLGRYYSDIDSEKANYYMRLFHQQWAKVRHNTLASGRQDWGDDL